MSRNNWIIWLSFIFALILMALPWSATTVIFRPEWLLLVIIYWLLAVPERIGIIWAWCLGLTMDVLWGSHFGLLAFSYAFVAYLILKLHLQLRHYPIWQQAIPVAGCVFLIKVFAVLFSNNAQWQLMVFPALVSGLFWPVTFVVLRFFRRTFRVR